jgi:hypothetical protein
MSPARPIDRSRSRLSPFTLAALEDSGWYVANYADAEPLDWGRGAGCDFVTSSCWDYMTKHRDQPYFCGKGSVNQTRCTSAATGWGVCRSSAFSDGCLLVGKYSHDTAAAVTEDAPPSGADGRPAACYSPPQLEAMQAGGAGGASLLPLLGGSYSAKANDICYNLVATPSGGSSSNNAGTNAPCGVPEDCGPAKVAAAKQADTAGGASQEAGSRSRQPLASAASLEALEKQSLSFVFYEQDAKAGERASGSGNEAGAAGAAACINLPAPKGAQQQKQVAESGSKKQDSKQGGSGRRLLASLLAAATRLRPGHQLQQQQAPVQKQRRLAAAAGAGSVSGLTAMAGAAFAAGVTAPAAACTRSPVLCFRSSCDAAGRLSIDAQLPDARTSRFACPSGKTVDLSAALPGRYLSGFLQCPSNALACEAVGCEGCSPSGGVCSQGKCSCHMERFGPGCRDTLVPPRP